MPSLKNSFKYLWKKGLFSLFIIFGIVFSINFSIHAQDSLPNTLSSAEKVFGLSKFWQEVNYNFVYFDKVDKKMWDDAFKENIVKVQESKNDYEYYRALSKFCALLKDGHTNIYLPKYLQEYEFVTMFGDYRLFLKNVDHKVIVERVNESKQDEIPIGSIITEVNGVSTDDYLHKHVKPYISSSTDYVLNDIAAYNLLKGIKGQSFQIKIQTPKGETKTLSVTHNKTTENEVFPAFEAELFKLQWHENGIAHISLHSFSDDKINQEFVEKLPELYKAKALIVDLRSNGGGNTNIGTDILKYLINDTILHHSRYSTREHRAAFKAWGIQLEPKDTVQNAWNQKCYLYNHDLKFYNFDYEPDTIHLVAKRLVVPTAVLIGHNTASAAEDFLISADNQKHFIKIGERTFGSTGQPYLFPMPGGGNARVCTKKDTYPDGREFVGVGIIPDIEVVPTLNDYINNNDVVLDKAIEYLTKKIK